MNIYLLKQNHNRGYDTFDSCVVIASSAEEARLIHPNPDLFWNGYGWKSGPNDKWFNDRYWTDPQNVTVEEIGTALPGVTQKVICASFNAG